MAKQLSQLLTEQCLVLPSDYIGLDYITLEVTYLPATQSEVSKVWWKL